MGARCFTSEKPSATSCRSAAFAGLLRRCYPSLTSGLVNVGKDLQHGASEVLCSSWAVTPAELLSTTR